MTELNIQYTTTDDGARIAYAIMGRGYPVVRMDAIVTPFSSAWRDPEFGVFTKRLSEHYQVVLYDGRGWGMSQRDAADFSLNARLKDLDAVVRATGRRRLAVWGYEWSAPVAVAYATQRPRSVRHLILEGGFSRAADITPWERLKPLIELCRTNWKLASQTLADLAHPTRAADDTTAMRITDMFRDAISGEAMAEWFRKSYEMDVTDLLPQVRTPTLVLHRRGDRVVRFALGQELAAQIPNARFVPLEGIDAAPTALQSEAEVEAIHAFLRPGSRGRAPLVRIPASTALATILFTDMASSTALTQRLGDAKAQELVRAHNAIVREALQAHEGSEIKHTGDGIMASFPSASSALGCAVAIQRAVAERHAEPVEASLRVRIGLNAGEPVAEEEDLFGTAVQLARRICDRAESGGILASNVVRELAAGKGFLFADRGEFLPKGFDEAVRLYEVRWREED